MIGKHVVLLKSGAQNRGGLEKYSARIASAFLEKGAKISILTTGASSSASALPARVYSTQTFPWPGFLRLEQFDRFVQRWLKDNPADLIFGMDRNRSQTHLRAGNGSHAAYLKSRLHTDGAFKHFICTLNPLHRKILQMEREAFENPGLQKLFTNSNMVKGEILTHYATDPNKIQVIHNGVEWAEMETDFKNWETSRLNHLQRLDLPKDCFHFLFIGNGYLRKGLGVLLGALAQLNCADFHLSVIGKDHRIEEYKALARKLGLKSRVRFFGPQADIRPFYQIADALAIPSFYDPFANVTIEALAMGLFVVSSKSNGGHEILTPQNGAIIEDLLNLESIADALRAALKKRKTKMSAAALRNSVAHLDFSHQMQTLIHACE
ncbi:MAG: glycosyltransferase family 4 protein [Chlamydiota bacterium]